jgi:hypothetical protein
MPSEEPQPSANCPNCCTGNPFSWWLKVHLLNTVIIEQVIQNHQPSLQKPGGEIPANYSILKLNRKSVQELSPPFKGGVAGPLGYRRPGGGG